MKCVLFFLLVLRLRHINARSIAKRSTFTELVDYLRKYDYYPEENAKIGEMKSKEELTSAIKNLQKISGLVPTGNPNDPELERVIKLPRCGVSDKELIADSDSPAAYKILGTRWETFPITWKAMGYSRDLDKKRQNEIFHEAFKIWENISDISTLEVPSDSPADIVITFSSRDGKDYLFDGPNGVLAHAFSPGIEEGGDVHFDDEESWIDTNVGNYFLLRVAVHEFGHALGIAHNKLYKSVMYPKYQPELSVILNHDDISAIRFVYGTESIAPKRCSLKVDSVALIRGDTIVFKERYFWRIYKNGELKSKVPEKISSHWKDLMSSRASVNAATDLPEIDLTIFFMGTRFWLLKGEKKPADFPGKGRDVRELGIQNRYKNNIDAAFYWGWNKRVYIFSGNMYWRLSNESRYMQQDGKFLKVEEDYPKIIDLWKDVPTPLDAAYTDHNGETFFFKGTQYWALDNKRMRLKLEQPKKLTDMLECDSFGNLNVHQSEDIIAEVEKKPINESKDVKSGTNLETTSKLFLLSSSLATYILTSLTF